MNPGLPHLVGWKEYVDFPEWGLRRVKVKLDTGARTSALGVLSYDLKELAGVGLVARMQLALYRRHPERIVTVEAPVLRTVVVTNSTGMKEQRPLIQAVIRLGPVTRRIRLTLTNRSTMLFPVILGRKALEGDCLVDPSKKYQLRRRKPGARDQGSGIRDQEPGQGTS